MKNTALRTTTTTQKSLDTLRDTPERVDYHEHLGVSILHGLGWEKHCNKITKMASEALGLLRRILSPCYKEVKSRSYQTFVRPQFEYAAEAWNTYNVTTADRIEHIQHAAARFVHYDYQRTT